MTVEERARKESSSEAVTRLVDEHKSPFLRSNFILVDHSIDEDGCVMIDEGVDSEVSCIMSGVDVERMLAGLQPVGEPGNSRRLRLKTTPAYGHVTGLLSPSAALRSTFLKAACLAVPR